MGGASAAWLDGCCSWSGVLSQFGLAHGAGGWRCVAVWWGLACLLPSLVFDVPTLNTLYP